METKHAGSGDLTFALNGQKVHLETNNRILMHSVVLLNLLMLLLCLLNLPCAGRCAQQGRRPHRHRERLHPSMHAIHWHEAVLVSKVPLMLFVNGLVRACQWRGRLRCLRRRGKPLGPRAETGGHRLVQFLPSPARLGGWLGHDHRRGPRQHREQGGRAPHPEAHRRLLRIAVR